MKINENKIKKLTLLAAILAPMIYLFGSLFAALQGAHGEQVFAGETTSDFFDIKTYVIEDHTCNYVVDEEFVVTGSASYSLVDLGGFPSGLYTVSLEPPYSNIRLVGVDSDSIIKSVSQVSDFTFNLGNTASSETVCL